MKFSRSLELNCVPEWAEYYVLYKQHKKLIAQIARARAEQFVAQDEDLSAIVVTVTAPILPTASTTATATSGSGKEHLESIERLFLNSLSQDLKKVGEFYAGQKQRCWDAWEALIGNASLSKFRSRRASFDESKVQIVNSSPILPGEVPTLLPKSRLTDIQSLYLIMNDMCDFLEVNHAGFTKIIEKHDKFSHLPVKKSFRAEVELALPIKDLSRMQFVLSELEKLYSWASCNGNLNEASSQLKCLLRERLVMARSTVLQEMLVMDRKAASVSVAESENVLQKPKAVSYGWGVKMATLFALFLLLLATPIFPDTAMNRCFAMCFFVLSLWATELIPLFATALLVPLLVVFLRLLKNTITLEPFDATTAASIVFSSMFSQVTMLLLGGFTIASAATKYGIALNIASRVLSISGGNTPLLLFCVMLLALASSALISNVAAPVLCFSLLHPMLRSLPTNSVLSRQLVLAVAFASNIGGMVSPISSPQNMIAIERMSRIGSGFGWVQWLLVSLPVCFISLGLCWFVLQWKNDEKHTALSFVLFHPTPVNWRKKEIFVLGVTSVTIILWCSGPVGTLIFGNMGVIAIIPMVCFFGSGVLGKDDFNGFPWSVVMLAMGGSALGEGVKSSGLLAWIAAFLSKITAGSSLFKEVLLITGFITLATSFISHTIGALIFIPIVQAIGEHLEDPRPKMMIMIAAFSCSAGMAMPVSSFPNINASAQEDGAGRSLVSPSEFIKYGIICSLLVWLTISSVGLLCMRLVGL